MNRFQGKRKACVAGPGEEKGVATGSENRGKDGGPKSKRNLT